MIKSQTLPEVKNFQPAQPTRRGERNKEIGQGSRKKTTKLKRREVGKEKVAAG